MTWPDHPVLGTPCRLSTEPRLCSRCDAEVGDVPLVFYGGGEASDYPDEGDIPAWQICDECLEPVMIQLAGPFPPPTETG